MKNAEKFVCKKCNGTGSVLTKPPDYIDPCPVCHGEKYLDWIEVIVGKRKKLKPLTFDMSNFDVSDSFYEEQRTILDEFANHLANEIDKMILGELIKDPKCMDENDGKFICKKCRGSGLQRDGQCEACKGFGHLDWIDNITGKSKKKKKNNISKVFSNRSGRVRIR